MTSDVVVLNGNRTPIGSYKGSLGNISATDLAVRCVSDVMSRCGHPDIHSLYLGLVYQAGLGQAPDKQVSKKSGLPDSVICTTINKVCASSLKALMIAADELRVHNYDKCCIVVGAENMTAVPEYVLNNKEHLNGLFHDGLIDSFSHKFMGLLVDDLAKKMQVSRQEQDEYAILSYERAIRAWDEDIFNKEIVQTPCLDRDEDLKRYNREKIPKLRLAFENGSSITAANASSISDGASALILCTRKHAEHIGIKPIARVVAQSDASVDPADFGIAPSVAIKHLLEKANKTVDDISLWEINEAFSAVALMNMKILSLDVTKVNVHGGAVAIGHPLGMSGARIATHLIHSLQKPGDLGVAAICNGSGGSSAVLFEKL